MSNINSKNIHRRGSDSKVLFGTFYSERVVVTVRHETEKKKKNTLLFEARSLQRPAPPEPAHLPAAVGADVDVDAKVVKEKGSQAAAAPQAGKINIPSACCHF